MVYTFDLNDRVIIVTGGYGYLGKAITESLLFHGARVYVLGKDKEKFAPGRQSESTFRFQLPERLNPFLLLKIK